MPLEGEIDKITKTETVIGIENNSRNSIEYTLDGVIDFMNFRHKIWGQIQSFQIICDLLGRNCQKSRDKTYLSRVDI
jgi:hypothetical protein